MNQETMLPYQWQKLIVKETYLEFMITIENLKVNKLCRISFTIQLSYEKSAEYSFVIGFCKVERNDKFNFLFGIANNSDLSLK